MGEPQIVAKSYWESLSYKEKGHIRGVDHLIINGRYVPVVVVPDDSPDLYSLIRDMQQSIYVLLAKISRMEHTYGEKLEEMEKHIKASVRHTVKSNVVQLTQTRVAEPPPPPEPPKESTGNAHIAYPDRACTRCKATYTPTTGNQKYCSKDCLLIVHGRRSVEPRRKGRPPKGSTAICKTCSKEFPKYKNQAFCSVECRPYKAYTKPTENELIKECAHCNDIFKASRRTQRFCNSQCTNRYFMAQRKGQPAEKPIKQCHTCRKDYEAKRNDQKYCSDECRQNAAIYTTLDDINKEPLAQQRKHLLICQDSECLQRFLSYAQDTRWCSEACRLRNEKDPAKPLSQLHQHEEAV